MMKILKNNRGEGTYIETVVFVLVVVIFLSFTLNLHYMQGDDGTLHNVHRVDVGAIDLKLYAKSNAASGWSSTEVQVYNG